MSTAYNASGFGHLHMLIRASGLSVGEEVVVTLYSRLWNHARTGYTAFVGYSVTLSGGTTIDDIVTVPVPSEDFHFAAVPQAGTSCNFYMSIYLTWS
ncbi:MAG: hypothetical protein JSV29_00255 [Candidatus Bathyarchaeota archaeon]|nr:MAG: hypothetical protein JSV29_00255 [Candidatus Bathyarchaeota archaeon]